jgi:hypothetical protein
MLIMLAIGKLIVYHKSMKKITQFEFILDELDKHYAAIEKNLNTVFHYHRLAALLTELKDEMQGLCVPRIDLVDVINGELEHVVKHGRRRARASWQEIGFRLKDLRLAVCSWITEATGQKTEAVFEKIDPSQLKRVEKLLPEDLAPDGQRAINEAERARLRRELEEQEDIKKQFLGP